MIALTIISRLAASTEVPCFAFCKCFHDIAVTRPYSPPPCSHLIMFHSISPGSAACHWAACTCGCLFHSSNTQMHVQIKSGTPKTGPALEGLMSANAQN